MSRKNILNINQSIYESLELAKIKNGTDQAIARYDGTSTLEGSTVFLTDAGNVTSLNAISFSNTSDQLLSNQLLVSSNLLKYDNENVVIQDGLGVIGNFPMYDNTTNRIIDSGYHVSDFPVISQFSDTFSFLSNGVGFEILTTLHFLKIGSVCTCVIKGFTRDFTSDNTHFLLCTAIPLEYRPTYVTDATISTIKSTTLANPALNTESDVTGLVRMFGANMYIYKQPPINDVPDYNFQWTELNAGIHTCSISYIIE